MSAFVLKQAFVTVHAGQWFDIDTIVQRWDENAELMRHGVKALAWGMLDVLVDGQFDVVQALDDEMEDLEDLLFDQSNGVHQLQRRTFALRKSLVRTRRAVLPMREVVNTLVRRDSDVPAELRPYLEDVYDHVLRATEWTESLRDLVTTILETNVTIQGNRLNVITKKVTSWAAIIAVPTFLASIWGMNFEHMPELDETWGYPLALALMVVAVASLYRFFKRIDWL